MNESRSGLKRFGRSFALLLALFFGLVLPYLFSLAYPIWPWAVASGIWLIAEIRPTSLRILQRSWLGLGLMLGRVVTPLLLAIVFYGLITPLGVLKRLVGASKIELGWRGDLPSYRAEPTLQTDLEDPF